MKLIILLRRAHPRHKLAHEARRIEWRGRLEDNANFLAALIKGADIIGMGLVLPPVTFVLIAVNKQITV